MQHFAKATIASLCCFAAFAPLLASTFPPHGAKIAPPPNSHPAVHNLILPTQFRGHWSEDLKDCRKAAVEDDQVWITGGALNYYETTGHITRLTLSNSHRALLTLRNEAEGKVFVSTKRLSLSPDDNALTIRDAHDASGTRFYRCGNVAKAG